jgi:carboxyl-terminal processing protease
LKTAIGVIIFSFALDLGHVAFADNPPPSSSTPAAKPPPDLARRIQEITDAVLENHIDPPARQQMILSGIKALYRAAGMPAPNGLGRRVSAIATTDQLAAFLVDVWPKSTAKPATSEDAQEAVFDGLLRDIPGGAHLLSAKETKVAEQFAGNRYVGLHIALGMDEQEKRPTMHDVFPGGPADRAGVKKGDILEEVDGVDTRGRKLRDIVEQLRGEEGTSVTIKVRQPKEAKSRTYTITRGALPRPTIEDSRQAHGDSWRDRLDVPDAIDYVKIKEIAPSTPHELRKLAQQLESRGVRALVLDLRGLGGSSVHPAVLLADCLLDHGPIGRVRTAHGETTYQADPDALFRGWPLAVLVDPDTSGTAEWLAAALQDNHRATIVGTPIPGPSPPGVRLGADHRIGEVRGIRSRVAVGDGSWSIELATGDLERGDGRPLKRPVWTALGEIPLNSLAPSGSLATRPESTFGVKPDLLVGGGKVAPPRRMIPQPGVSGPAPQPATPSGGPLKAAIESLKDSLTKTQPSGAR